MKLQSLEKLHKSMISIGVDIQQFKIKTGTVEFDCLFSVREVPFSLSLTSRGINPKFFRFEVHNGYWIKEYFGDMYSDLLSLLKIDGRSGKKLIPKNFLAQVNALIPHTAKPNRVPTPEQILRLRHDLEERDRPYFDTWILWGKESGRGPSKENLNKTLLILGVEAYNYSKKMNASSKWSANPTGRSWNQKIKNIT